MVSAETKGKLVVVAKAKKASSGGAAGAGTKAKVKKVPSSNSNDNSNNDSAEDKIVKVLSRRYKFGKAMAINNEMLAKECKTHVRTKSYVEAKKTLLAKGIIEGDSGGFMMTEKGAESAGIVKQDMSQFKTNEEYQTYIKSTLTKKWKGAQIFDLLHENGPLTRQELCGHIGIKSGTHSFSYGLKELKDYGYVGQSPKGKMLLCLTQSASLPPSATPPATPPAQPSKAKGEQLPLAATSACPCKTEDKE